MDPVDGPILASLLGIDGTSSYGLSCQDVAGQISDKIRNSTLNGTLQ